MVTEEAFELLDLLGTGGFAHTYRARVLDLDLAEDFGTEEVALKIPLDKKKELVLRHELETNISLHLRLKELDSTNIVRYLGFAVFQKKLVMAMEYVRGGNLRHRIGKIGRQKPLPADEAVEIAVGVLKGLAIIHQEHVFHRDIKPENILMAGNTPKVADLGISRMLNPEEKAGTVAGTIFYMSPEILSTQGATFSSDTWSLGVMLYEMVVGRLPFGGDHTAIGTMVDLICNKEHVPACEASADVPGELSDIIDRALKKRPGGRYESVTEMHDALHQFQEAGTRELERELAAVREQRSCNDSAVVEGELKKLVEKYPDSPRVYQELGEFYNLCQRHREAILAFKEGLKHDPDSAPLHFDIALAYQKTGNRDAAVRHLKKVVSLDVDASLGKYAKSLLRALGGEST